jgi:hypothetical protein
MKTMESALASASPACTQDGAASHLRRGALLTLLYAACFLASGAILTGPSAPPIEVRHELRTEQAPVLPSCTKEIVDGSYSIVNMRHWAVSQRGLAYDQLRRLAWIAVLLLCYGFQRKCSSLGVRRFMGTAALIGAAGHLSDILSYWFLGGVADWIGLNHHVALSPTDFSAYLCPAALAFGSLWGLIVSMIQLLKRLASSQAGCALEHSYSHGE